ncbi:hypothetical protein [Bradyrhizobium sp. UFLA05-112]
MTATAGVPENPETQTSAPLNPGDDNPYPAAAVETFGTPIAASAEFKFMSDARELLSNYLKLYPLDAKDRPTGMAAVGGAITVTGGNGSGKTFLLKWLRAQAASLASLKCRFLYAKADDENVVNVYRQFVRNLAHDDLRQVVDTALQRIGEKIVGAARATKDAAPRVQSGALTAGVDTLDVNELYLKLRQQLSEVGDATAVSTKFAIATGLINEPSYGAAAFELLSGGAPAQQGPPLPAALWTESFSSADTADIAVNALECLTALFRIAGIPLVLLLDQLENFVPADPMRAATAASIVKKMVEQVARQDGVIVLTGTVPVFERFPRDVSPRFYQREPVVAGHLSRDETRSLLSAHARNREKFTETAIGMIRDLSGGNPREILRIAHEAWALSAGRPASVTNDSLVAAAGKTGSLADRAKVARQVIDNVVARANFSARTDLVLAGGGKIDRLIVPTGSDLNEPSLAIVIATASDATQEAAAGLSLATTRRDLAKLSPAPAMLVVAVGYASDRVQALLRDISSVMTFEEETFSQDIEREISQLVLAPRSNPAAPGKPPGESAMPQVLAETLEKLERRLAQIEADRQVRARESAEDLAEQLGELSEHRQQESKGNVRWELLDQVERLRLAAREHQLDRERSIVRSMLVANELQFKSTALDFLCGAYLDSLDWNEATRVGDSPDGFLFVRQFEQLRLDIVRSMRGELLRGAPGPWSIRQPHVAASISGLVAFVAAIALSVITPRFFAMSPDDLWLKAALSIGPASLVGLVCFVALRLIATPALRFGGYQERIRGLQHDAERANQRR